MIARVWTAKVRKESASRYARHFTDHVVPALKGIDGYKQATLLQRVDADPAELVVISWWTSTDAIREFAGSDIDRAVVADEAQRMLLSFDETVRHYSVVVEDSESST